MSDAIVSPPAHGAARHWEYSRDVESAASPGNASAMFTRGGGQYNAEYTNTAGDLGIAGGDSGYAAALNSRTERWAWVRGRRVMSPGASPVVVRPVAKFTWPLGLRVVEGVIRYASGGQFAEDHTSTDAGRFSGVGFFVQPTRDIITAAPASNSTQGFGVGGNLGSLWWTSRGPGGLERVNLSAMAALGVASIDTPNKFRMEIRNATASKDASVTLYINDVYALTRSWSNKVTDYLPWVDTVGGTDSQRLEQVLMHMPGGNNVTPGSTLLYRDLINYKAPDLPGV